MPIGGAASRPCAASSRRSSSKVQCSSPRVRAKVAQRNSPSTAAQARSVGQTREFMGGPSLAVRAPACKPAPLERLAACGSKPLSHPQPSPAGGRGRNSAPSLPYPGRVREREEFGSLAPVLGGEGWGEGASRLQRSLEPVIDRDAVLHD